MILHHKCHQSIKSSGQTKKRNTDGDSVDDDESYEEEEEGDSCESDDNELMPPLPQNEIGELNAPFYSPITTHHGGHEEESNTGRKQHWCCCSWCCSRCVRGIAVR